MKLVLRLIAAIPLLVLLGSGAIAEEFRGLFADAWYPHRGLKSHEEVTELVRAAKAANFNAVIVQVRKRGDAYYNSHVEPKSPEIAADYDPLADVIEQAHAVGMEVHAWLTVYDVWHTLLGEADEKHIIKIHPEWIMTDVSGGKTFVDGRIYVDPGVPEVQDHFVSMVADVLKNYDVDGINLDSCRYPTPTFGYNPLSVACFNNAYGRTGTPTPNDKEWCSWRCSQVTDLVRKVGDEVRKAKPKVKLSASVMTHSPAQATDGFLQQWDVWSRQGLVDFLIPMVYAAEQETTGKFANALKHAYGRHIYIGIGGYRISSEEAIKQVDACRSAGAKGVVLYSYHCMSPNSDEKTHARISDLGSGSFAEPAALPALPWK